MFSFLTIPSLFQAFVIVLGASGLAFLLAHALVIQRARASGAHLSSRPVYYGWYGFAATLLPPVMLALLGWLLPVPAGWVRGAMCAGAFVSMLGMFFWVQPGLNAQLRLEQLIRYLLIGCGAVVFVTGLGIALSLATETTLFFAHDKVDMVEFFTGTTWSAQTEAAFGALPLFYGTFFVAILALIFAAPIGLFSAIYLAEYASPTTRRIVKPLLEILAGVPTVVYGFFALLVVGPLIRDAGQLINTILRPFLGTELLSTQPQSALSGALVMGIMILPYISSLSDDALRSVPPRLKHAALSVGATRSEALRHVIMPAAFPGLLAAMLLAVSRAVGETMIVLMAVGDRPRISLNPFDEMSTVTSQIVTLLSGDSEFDSPKTLSAFALGAMLFILTLCFNLIAQRIAARQRRRYA